jgi:hypothetical protein
MKRRKEMQKRVFAQNLGIIFVGSSGRAPGDLRGFVLSQFEKTTDDGGRAAAGSAAAAPGRSAPRKISGVYFYFPIDKVGFYRVSYAGNVSTD